MSKDLPIIIVFDFTKYAYWTKHTTEQEEYTAFLDSIHAGSLEPILLEHEEPTNSGSNVSANSQVKEFIIEHLWQFLGLCFLIGFICGVITIKMIKQTKSETKRRKKMKKKQKKK